MEIFDEIENGVNDPVRDDNGEIPVASAVSNPSPVASAPNTNSIRRPVSTSNPLSRTNPLAPPPPARRNHQFIDDSKAATINRLLQITGFLAFVDTIVAICLSAIVGVDVIIGVVLGGIATGIAGMFVSCGFQHLRSFQIRTAIVVFFSILCMACAVAEYVAISRVEACAVLSANGSSAYEYYGQAKYYIDAQTCAATDQSPTSHCNCVSDQQDCVQISFTKDCSSVLNQAPQLAIACVVISLAQFAFALFALLRLIMSTCTCCGAISRLFKRLVNSMGYEPLPVPDNSPVERPPVGSGGTSSSMIPTRGGERPADNVNSSNNNDVTTSAQGHNSDITSQRIIIEV